MESNESLLSKLQKKFIADMTNELVNPIEFMNHYLKEGKLDEYKVISLRLNEFQTLYKNYITHSKNDKPR
jgi:hypothetical protein